MYSIPFFLCLKSHPLINFLQASGSAGTRQIYPPSRHPPLVRGRIFLPVLCPFPGCSFSYSTFWWIYHFTNLLPTRSFFKLFVFLPLSCCLLLRKQPRNAEKSRDRYLFIVTLNLYDKIQLSSYNCLEWLNYIPAMLFAATNNIPLYSLRCITEVVFFVPSLSGDWSLNTLKLSTGIRQQNSRERQIYLSICPAPSPVLSFRLISRPLVRLCFDEGLYLLRSYTAIAPRIRRLAPLRLDVSWIFFPRYPLILPSPRWSKHLDTWQRRYACVQIVFQFDNRQTYSFPTVIVRIHLLLRSYMLRIWRTIKIFTTEQSFKSNYVFRRRLANLI